MVCAETHSSSPTQKHFWQGMGSALCLASDPVSETLLSEAAPAAQSALHLTSVSANCCLPCAILSVVLSIFSVLFSIRSRWPASEKGTVLAEAPCMPAQLSLQAGLGAQVLLHSHSAEKAAHHLQEGCPACL